MIFPIQKWIDNRLEAFRAEANSADGRDDGFLLEDSIFWGQTLRHPSGIAKGFKFNPIPIHDAPVPALMKNRVEWETFFRQLNTDEVLQLHLFMSTDYSREVDFYEAQTAKEPNPFIRRVRAERAARIRRDIARRELVRPTFYGFLSKPLPVMKDTEFAERFRTESRLLGARIAQLSAGGGEVSVSTMTDRDHLGFIERMMNPQYTEAEMQKRPVPNPYKSIFEQTVATPFHGGNLRAPKGKDAGPALFHFGGFYHAYIVVRELPEGMTAHPMVLSPLMACGVRNMHACTTIQRRDLKTEQADLRKQIEKLQNAISPLDSKGQPKRKIDHAQVAKDTADLNALLQRQIDLEKQLILPFDHCLTVRTWAKTVEQLESQIATLRGALESINGMRVLTVDNKVSAEKFFFQSLAGNSQAYGHWMRGWNNYVESNYMMDFIPLFGSFLGNTDKPSFVFDGAQNNMVSIDLFPRGVPQNFLFIGAPRAGKSNTVEEFLSQQTGLGFLGIADDGNTHGAYVRLMGGQSIVVSPNTGQCFNYFDTFGAILTPDHMLGQIALILEMGARDLGNLPRVEAILNKYIEVAYADKVKNVIQKDQKRWRRIGMEACAFRQFLAKMQERNPDALEDEAFTDFRNLRARKDAEIAALIAGISEDTFATFSQDEDNQRFIIRYAVSDLSRAEALRHRDVMETMAANPARYKQFDAVTVADVAAVMSTFAAGGANGSLFDGVANIDITGNIIQFELGRIDDKAKRLKSTVQHLIFTFLRARVTAMPRGIKKCILIEEIAKVLKTKIGPAAYAELLAQMPKFNCLVGGVLQDPAQLDDAEKTADGITADSVLSKQKCYFILRQDNAKLMERLAETIQLPKSCVRTVLEFKAPDQLDPNNAYASVLFFQKTGARPTVGVCRIKPNPEVMYVAASNGEEYDARMNALANYSDLLTGVIAEARKERPHLYPRQFALQGEAPSAA